MFRYNAGMSASSTGYSGGRRADAARNDDKVLEAAREVFLELGAQAPVSEIARRAGVGMGTLYRRYPTKEDLIRRVCVVSMERTTREALAALEDPDPWSGFAGFMERCTEAGVGGLSHLAGAFSVTDDVREIAERAREAMQALIDRASDEGPLRPGLTAADVSALLQQLLPRDTPGPEEVGALRRRYLAVILHGLRGTEPLPGPAASWQDVAARWSATRPPSITTPEDHRIV